VQLETFIVLFFIVISSCHIVRLDRRVIEARRMWSEHTATPHLGAGGVGGSVGSDGGEWPATGHFVIGYAVMPPYWRNGDGWTIVAFLSPACGTCIEVVDHLGRLESELIGWSVLLLSTDLPIGGGNFGRSLIVSSEIMPGVPLPALGLIDPAGIFQGAGLLHDGTEVTEFLHEARHQGFWPAEGAAAPR
jgi:hypothetical protein